MRTDLGLLIQKQLLDQGRSQRSLAEQMSVPDSYISQLIHHDTRPSAAAVERVGVALGLDATSIDRWHLIALKAAEARLGARYWAKVKDLRGID